MYLAIKAHIAAFSFICAAVSLWCNENKKQLYSCRYGMTGAIVKLSALFGTDSLSCVKSFMYADLLLLAYQYNDV